MKLPRRKPSMNRRARTRRNCEKRDLTKREQKTSIFRIVRHFLERYSLSSEGPREREMKEHDTVGYDV